MSLGQPSRALADLDEAIRLDPQLAEAYAARALAHVMLGNDQLGKKDMDLAVSLGFDRAVLQREVDQARRGR